MVWRRNGTVVLFPILCLIYGLASKILETYYQYRFTGEDVHYVITYLSCILATTLWCTILIVLRIVAIVRANKGAGGKLGEYRHVIEILVESSALHSATLIIYVVLEAMDSMSIGYFDALAVFTTGIAPTLLAGRVAAGRARPDNSWEGSIVSSLRFEAHQQIDADTCSQANCMSNGDLEAQSTQVDELEEISEKKRF
ncbi:hypothetical protein F5146DRAFT_1073324 [Armillaria mellea]|nr:hypothetical protein F5146DRAFT_1073324 [Armillaria mellea]